MSRGELDESDERDVRMQIEMMQQWAREYDFRTCISDHNLTDENDVKLDFRDRMALKTLDPRIGREIEALIDELNGDQEDQKVKKGFTTAAGSYSTEESDDSSTPTDILAAIE